MRRTAAWGCAAAVVLLVAAGFVYLRLYSVPSPAMETTFHCARPVPGCTSGRSDRVAAVRLWWPFDGVSRGDLVVFRTPPKAARLCGVSGTFLKRVVGLPGERWAERRGVILIDGRPLQEPYVQPDRRDHGSFTARRIPPDSYVVLGDNRVQSCDSRVWGWVPRGDLVAKVVATYWPPGRLGFR
jgi:signal peptidase I